MARRTIEIEVMDEETDESVSVELPATWEICQECDGEGASSAYLGAITEEDRQDWSEESWESYLAGGYDRPCECCKGSGKTLVVDVEALSAEQKPLYEAYLAHEEDMEQDRIECEYTMRMERGGGYY